MAIIIQFPTDYPPHQWPLRQQMLRLLGCCGIDREEFNERYMREGSGRTWGNLSDGLLLQIIEGLQNKRARQYHERQIEKAVAQCKPAPASQARRAVIVSFPTPPEALARIKARQKAVAKEARKDKPAAVTSPAPAAAPTNDSRREAHRRAMIQKAQVKLRDLYKTLEGFDDDAYRYTLQERWGVDSSTKLNNWQLHELLLHLAELERLADSGKGGKGKNDSAPSILNHDPTGLGREAQMRKIEKMLKAKGEAEGTKVPWGYAVAILKRHTGGVVTRFDDATPENLGAVIAALFQDARRKGRRTR